MNLWVKLGALSADPLTSNRAQTFTKHGKTWVSISVIFPIILFDFAYLYFLVKMLLLLTLNYDQWIYIVYCSADTCMQF